MRRAICLISAAIAVLAMTANVSAQISETCPSSSATATAPQSGSAPSQDDRQKAIALTERGKVDVDEGKNDLAIADETAAIGLKPDFEPAFAIRAKAHEMKAEAAGKASARPNGTAADANEAMSEFDLAIADASEAIRLNP